MTVTIYAKTALFENRVNLEKIKILRTWSVLMSPKKHTHTHTHTHTYIYMRTDQVLIT
jgi:hypothetical protein